MKILSRMLSKKIDPQNPEEGEFEMEREALDDAGQVRSNRIRSAALSQPIVPQAEEEPEVAGSGWAQQGDWDDDWDDDEDWGVEDDPASKAEARRRTEDKEHLVSEIRDAVSSVSHLSTAAEDMPMPSAPKGKNLSMEEDLGRRALARSQLEIRADEAEDRLMEKTEDVMSDEESSRRRSALAHMKAAAAATKADLVLQHVATRDGAVDPEEQSPYRDDLAKVVRPHSTGHPIGRAASAEDAQSADWDQGAADDDVASFGASDVSTQQSDDSDMRAAEELRLARAPTALSEEDFAADDETFAMSQTKRDFPSSRFADPMEEDDLVEDEDDDFAHAAEDIAEQSRANAEYDDPFADDDDAGAFADDFDIEEEDAEAEDDDGPRPSSAVAAAIAYATAPDEKLDEIDDIDELVAPAPASGSRKKIWEIADEVAAEVETARAAEAASPESELDPGPAAPAEPVLEVSGAAISGRAGRSAGRVKTRLLGFQADDEAKDVFSNTSATTAPVVADKFPTGWIVVVDGPGRGASFSVHAGVSQIGRGEDQTVRLDFGDTSISRNNHAAVAFDEEQGKFFLGHGGKSNLVRLNGQPVLSTEEMVDGDRIRIGETSLKFIALCGDDFSWNGIGDDGEDA